MAPPDGGQASSTRATLSLPSEHERLAGAGAGDPDKFFFAQRLAQALGFAERALHVLVDRALFEEQDGFAAGALPGIAALHAPRLVAKGTLAAVAADLN